MLLEGDTAILAGGRCVWDGICGMKKRKGRVKFRRGQ
jgi:hypothetical protein